jgi:hypothetical protein
MAETYRIDVIADIQKYVKPLSDLPGITKANAEKAAIALATSLGSVEGAAEKATAQVQAFNKSLIEQGVSEKAAAAASLKYASSLAAAGAAAQKTAAVVDQTAENTVAQGVSLQTTAAAALAYDRSMAGGAASAATFGQTAANTAGKAANFSAALTAVGQQGQDMAVQLQGGTSVTTVMLQQLPQLVGQLSTVGYGLGSIAAVAGPLAVAIAALAAGYAVYANATFDAEQANIDLAISFDGTLSAAQKMRAGLDAITEAHRQTMDSSTDAGMALAEMAGEIKDYEIAAGAAARAVIDGAADEKQARQALNSTMNARLLVLRQAIAADETDSNLKPKLIQQERELAAAYSLNIRELRALEEATYGQAAAISDATVAAGKAKEAEEEARRKRESDEASRRAHEKAIRAQEEALRALSQAMQAENDAAQQTQRTYQSAIDAINGIERAQKQATASEKERVDMALSATLDTIAAEERKALAVSNSVAAEETIHQEAERARAAARATHIDALRGLDEKRTEDARKAAEEQQRIEEAASNARIQLASTLAGAIGTIAQTAGANLTDEQKQAAEVLYAIQKASALAVIALNTILAVSQASTSAPAPYNVIPMAIAGAQGAASFAAAAASPPPKFHAGTLSAGPGPGSARRGNEFTAVLEGGEGIIPRATMQQPGAKEQAAALVSGRSPVAADEVAKGMDRSSVPYYLEQILRMAKKPAPRTRTSRPGHKRRSGAA